MSQTFVNPAGMPPAFAGMIADSGPHDILTGFSDEPVNQIPWGVGLMKGLGGDQSYRMPTGASGTVNMLGLNVYKLTQKAGSPDAAGNYIGDLGASGLLPQSKMEVGVQGRFWVPIEGNVVRGDRPFCRTVATGATTTQGVWAGTGVSGYNTDCRKQGVFRSAPVLSADGTTRIAILDVDFITAPF